MIRNKIDVDGWNQRWKALRAFRSRNKKILKALEFVLPYVRKFAVNGVTKRFERANSRNTPARREPESSSVEDAHSSQTLVSTDYILTTFSQLCLNIM